MNHSIKKVVSFLLVFTILITTCTTVLASTGTSGSITGGVIDLRVMILDDTDSTDKYGQDPSDIVEKVKESFIEASNYLYEATKGQNRFGKITIYVPAAREGGWPEIQGALPMDNFNPEDSDVYIRPGRGASANLAGFMGSKESHMYIGIDKAFDTNGTHSLGKTIVHEFGHYGYGLGDEYCDYETKNGRSYQVFGTLNADGSITWNTCESQASMLMRDSNGNTITEVVQGENYRPSYNSNGAKASIMWVQHESSIVDFCDSSHNSSAPSHQNRIHGNKSCWEVMVENKKFNLTAPGGNIQPIEKKDPVFEVRQNNKWNDIALVIDKSGSMSGSKIQLAKGAAKMFVDCLELPQEGQLGDGISVVSFENSATLNHSLTRVATISDKSAIKSKIDNISSGGGTNIGAGLRNALNDMISKDYRKGAGAIILLSDGQASLPSTEISLLKSEGIPVYTIGVGSGADANLLTSIAKETGGEYYFVSSAGDISMIYKTIKNKLSIFDRLIKFIRRVFSSMEESTEVVFVDSSMKQAVFTISSVNAGNVSFTLKAPDGTIYSPDSTNGASYIIEDTYQIYIIDNPQIGAWEVNIKNNSQANTEISFDFSGRTTLSLQGSTDDITYTYPTPVKITALLSKNGKPVINANVYAKVIAPDNSETIVTLYDNGQMGDLMPGDGLYTAFFSEFKGDGGYQISIHANNDDLKAIEGEAFVDIEPDENGMVNVPEVVYLNENFTRSLTLPTITVSGTSNQVSIVQLDNDVYTLDESNQSALVTVRRSGNLRGTMSVDYSTKDGSAVADVDYAAPSGTLTFEAGEAEKTIEIKLLKVPSQNEARTKNFKLTLENPVNAVLGVPSVAEIYINRTKLSNNADLKNLVTDCGSFDKPFSPDVTDYKISVPYSTDKISVTASVYDIRSKLTINGNPVLSGYPSAGIDLNTGTNKIPVVVTAEDGVTEKTYMITVYRASKPSGGTSSGSKNTPEPTSTPTQSPTPTQTSTPTSTPTATPDITEKPIEDIPGISGTDAEGHWAEPYILDLLGKGIINKYPDGSIKPDSEITRAEAVTILVNSLNLKAQNPDKLDFSDADEIPEWVREAVAAAQENGIIKGFEDKSFRADSKLTRNQACAMIMNAFNLGISEGETDFEDDKDIALWAKGFVKKANELGIIKGYENNYFLPERIVTRAEMFTMIYHTMKIVNAE